MLIQFLQALQTQNYDEAASLAVIILSKDPGYKPALAFLEMYRSDRKNSNIQ